MSHRAGNRKVPIHTLLKLSTEKEKNDLLETEVKFVIRKLTEASRRMEIGAASQQGTEDAAAANVTAEGKHLVLIFELEMLKTSQTQS